MSLWNFSTAIRNPDRIQGFSTALKDFEGKKWTPKSGNQENFQITLIQKKLYLAEVTANEENISWDRAREIAKSRNWLDASLRGRMSLSPLSKLGLCYVDDKKILHITDLGKKLSNNEIKVNEYFAQLLLKYQLPQHDKDSSYSKRKGYNIIPLIGILQFINKVNKLYEKKGKKPVGISKLEFDIFVPTLIHHKNIYKQAETLIRFREEYKKAKTSKEKKLVYNKFTKLFADGKIKSNWDNPNDKDVKDFKNTLHEYGDNIRRYFRISDWISLRGNGYYIDLNPRKQIENESILAMNCSPIVFKNDEEYSKYLSDLLKPKLPWKESEKLIKKYNLILKFTSEISKKYNIKQSITPLSDTELKKLEQPELESALQSANQELQRLDKLRQEHELINVDKISEVIQALKNLGRDGSAALELEHQTTRGLIALDDGRISPNYPIGDDGEPLFTAPGGVGDIECFYEKFNLLCEVTMLTNRQQWQNEGIPVSRHYREFAEKRNFSETYCLFIAPALHPDTVEIFYLENRKRSEDKRTKTIPFTISQFIEILELLIKLKQKTPKTQLIHEKILKLYEKIIFSSTDSDDEIEWRDSVQPSLDSWKEEILTAS